jgi:hypothetical protein
VHTRRLSRGSVTDKRIIELESYSTRFQGQVIYRPEEAMPGTAFSTGGEVEHKVRSTFQLLSVFYTMLLSLQVIMIGGILFFRY